jgi:hypothetical protein
MAVVLIATPAHAEANSFATIEQANAYNESHLYGEEWAEADDTTKAKALITATRLIVDAFHSIGWSGTPTHSSVQALPFPRVGLFTRNGWTIDSMTIPFELVQATSEMARRLIVAGSMPENDAEGIKSVKAGPVDVEFQPSYGKKSQLPDAVWAMISFLAQNPSSGGGITVPLVRV